MGYLKKIRTTIRNNKIDKPLNDYPYTTFDYSSVLHYLANYKFSEDLTRKLFELFKEKGANFELKNKNGNTPLLEAARQQPFSGRQCLIELLLEENANPNATNHKGQNVLHLLARISESRELVELALEKGANPYKKDQNGLTAKDIAQSLADSEMIGLLTGSKKYFLSRIIRRTLLVFLAKAKSLLNRLKAIYPLKSENPHRSSVGNESGPSPQPPETSWANEYTPLLQRPNSISEQHEPNEIEPEIFIKPRP